jgi:hypothetical protein
VPVSGADRLAFLAEGVDGTPGPFARPAPVPAMPWIDNPESGWIAGTVAASRPGENDTVEVTIVRRRYWPFGNRKVVRTDGNGYFGVARLAPGRYEVSIEGRFSRRTPHEASVRTGRRGRTDQPSLFCAVRFNTAITAKLIATSTNTGRRPLASANSPASHGIVMPPVRATVKRMPKTTPE